MFDMVGQAALDSRPLSSSRSLDTAFSTEPWTDPFITRQRLDSPGAQVLALGRNSEADDHAAVAQCHLFVVGEAFGRLRPEGRQAAGRLSARQLLDMYLERDVRLIHAIKGNFTLIILDRRKSEIHILSSHFAVSPLYYAYDHNVVYFSTSLAQLARLLPHRPELDPAALIETTVFNWPIHERTFLKGVKRVAPGAILTFRAGGMCRWSYWDQRPLYEKAQWPADEALEHGSSLFHRCTNQLLADEPKICASFTSGFDSRAIHSVLEMDRSHVLAYSFGVPGAINVSIPEAMCARLGYPFKAFYLDKRFEDVFDSYARQTVLLSDGFVVQRANYPYAFRALSDFAPVVVTGIFGSEFLRTFQNLGEFVSASWVRLNRSDDPRAELRAILAEHAAGSYLLPEILAAGQADVEADVAEWFQWSEGLQANQRLHLYLVYEASRKYFGAEISTERPYATNRFPFLDVDFVEFMYQAPFAGVHSQPVSPTVSDRFNSQYFYAYLIRRYRPELLPYPTDHGYAPADLLKRLPLLHAGPKHVWSRVWQRLTHYQEFTPREWLTPFYQRCLFPKLQEDFGFIAPRFQDDFRSGAWTNDIPAFDKIAALHLWLDEWF